MRNFLVSLGVLLLLGQALSAETLVVNTSVSEVELHPDGMRVFRSFDIDLPAGSHRIVFRDFRIDADIGSLQVDFRGARARISGFQLAMGPLSPVEPPRSQEWTDARATWLTARKRWQDIDTRKQQLSARINGAKLRIEWLKSLTRSRGIKAGFPTADLIAANGEALQAAYMAARKDVDQAQRGLDDLGDDLQRARKAVDGARAYLESLEPGDPNRQELSFVIRLDAPYSGPAAISYVSTDGWWRANYELRLRQRGRRGSATLVRRAAIRNTSGERWKGVKARLSTAAVFADTSVADPRAITAWLNERGKPEPLRKTRPGAALAAPEPSIEVARSESGFSGYSRPVLTGQVLEFDIPDPQDIKGDGGAVVWLDSVPLDVSLVARIVPARAEKAYLAARLTNRTGGPILSGSVNIFRDGVYVGEGDIPQVGIGADFELSFGVYDGVEVTRRLVERMDGDIGVISSRSNRVIRHRTVVKSHLDFALPVRVLGAVPVSRDEKLVINTLARPRPDEVDVDGKRGVLAWNFDLPAGGEKTIEFGYEARWPPEKLFRSTR